MISVIISSFKEPKTIGKCIKCIADSRYSGITSPFEIIQVSPDEETLNAGKEAALELNLSINEYKQVIDPHKGKPFALRMALNEAHGDLLVFTDGDTYFEKDAVRRLLEPFKDDSVGGVSGRPMSMDSRNNIFGYWGHLLSDSGDHRRKNTMVKVKDESYYISDKSFFPTSGYIMATKNVSLDLPQNVLSDDAYISYSLRNQGYNIAYTPNAICYVKYPTSLMDYYKQKVRSIGGFKQLKQFGVFKKDKQSRSFIIELPYALFVLKYAKNLKEFIWSLALFPVRLMTWVKIFIERDLLKKDMPSTGWERIESTK